MKLIVTIVILHIVASQATNVTEEASTNKTKRTIANQVQSYGENRPVLLYPDNSGPPTFYTPVTIKPVFDPEVPKQVAAQQVLYEFQQTPTNAVSNVHVNQFYQPVTNRPETPLPTNTGPAQFISGSETVAAPVQHSALIRHGQNFAQVQFQPQHIQTQQYVPGKYLYVNGKILYQPNQPQQQQNGLHQRPVNFLYTHPQTGTQKFVPQVPLIRPMAYRRFHPPQPHQFQKITKPMNVPEVTEAQPEEEPIEENKEEEEEEAEDVEEEEKASEESNDDDDHDNYYSKYSFDDEDEDHGSYREEEDDDDNERGSSRPVPKKHKSKKSSKPNKYSKSNNYKFSENYSSSSKYDKPGKKGKKTGKAAPKMHYKSVKYIKEGNGKPRFERIEGKQSQNIPVIHKQKIFKEKWFVTKSTDDSITK